MLAFVYIYTIMKNKKYTRAIDPEREGESVAHFRPATIDRVNAYVSRLDCIRLHCGRKPFQILVWQCGEVVGAWGTLCLCVCVIPPLLIHKRIRPFTNRNSLLPLSPLSQLLLGTAKRQLDMGLLCFYLSIFSSFSFPFPMACHKTVSV